MGRNKIVDNKNVKPKANVKKFVKKEVVAPKKKDSHKNILRVMGAKDISSSDYKFLNPIIKKMEETALNYSFSKVETPILEDSSLYKKFFDKNKSKMLFSLEPHGLEKLVLRPDLVHGLIRSFVESGNINNLEKPYKFFSWVQCFVKKKLGQPFTDNSLSLIFPLLTILNQ